MLRVDPATGKSQVLFTETARDKSWINLTDNYRFLRDGSLIWWSERDGFGHLYRLIGSKWQQLTKGRWMVTSLDGVDERAASSISPARRTMCWPIRSMRWITTTGRAQAPDRSRPYEQRQHGPQRADAGRHPQRPEPAGRRPIWPMAPASASRGLRRTRSMARILMRPSWPPTRAHFRHDQGQGWHRPALEDDHPGDGAGQALSGVLEHYGGPHVQVVNKGWASALAQAIVAKGYIYFEIDNRGSANRGVDFESQIWHAMGTVEVDDQIAGADYLKSLPFVDAQKIATYGWSYGGYMTLKMLEAASRHLAAGISGAPVTKWELYDTHYTERYMGDPRLVAAAYKASAIDKSGAIRDPLLLIHGLSDDNVVFENSSALIAKMQNEATPFEMMLYPGHTHRVGGPKVSVHLWNTIFAFLARHGVTPP
jgi:dipeptidyl-peptidase-4